MLQELYKILVMKDILHKPEQPDQVEKFIKKLKLCKRDETLLLNKYCFDIKDKQQIYNLEISARQFYKLKNKVLIRAYDSMRRRIRYGI